MYRFCLSINLQYTETDAVQICDNFWDTQYDNRYVIYSLVEAKDFNEIPSYLNTMKLA